MVIYHSFQHFFVLPWGAFHRKSFPETDKRYHLRREVEILRKMFTLNQTCTDSIVSEQNNFSPNRQVQRFPNDRRTGQVEIFHCLAGKLVAL